MKFHLHTLQLLPVPESASYADSVVEVLEIWPETLILPKQSFT